MGVAGWRCGGDLLVDAGKVESAAVFAWERTIDVAIYTETDIMRR